MQRTTHVPAVMPEAATTPPATLKLLTANTLTVHVSSFKTRHLTHDQSSAHL